MLYHAIGNDAMYEIGTNWNKLEKFQLCVKDDVFLVMFATWHSTIVFRMGIKRLQFVGPGLIDLDN